MTGFTPYILIIVLIMFSAFFSGSETAFTSANALRLKRRSETGKTAGRWALFIYERYETALIAILIGNNLVNIAASSVAAVIAISLLGDAGAWLSTGIMTVLILTFGEIMPKIVARSIADDFCNAVSIPLRVLMTLLYPVIKAMEWVIALASRLWQGMTDDGPTVTEDDLENIIETVEDEGVIDEDRADLLQSALDFDDVLAYEIITPRVDMQAIDMDDDMDDILRELMESPYSRLPVYEDTIDNIIGVLHLNRVLKRMVDEEQIDHGVLRELLMPAWFVHKTMPLDDVLSVMKRRKSHMVIVTDEYGGTMGVLTMEDVLEQLVGDIWDETDEVIVEFKKIGRDLYEADGDMRIYDFFDELDIDDRDFDDDNATLGGWAIEMLGGYPKTGDSFKYKNLTITVKKRTNMRVRRLTVSVDPAENDDD